MTDELIGKILVDRGLIDDAQLDKALRRQRTDERRLCTLATEMFDLDEQQVFQALADQLCLRCPEASLATEWFDAQCLRILSAREAWDHLVLPMHFDGDELLCATTVETMPWAIKLLQKRTYLPFKFVLAEVRPLEQFISELYAFEGVEVAE